MKHDLEIRELQAATFRTLLVKQDEPVMQASKAATGLFVTKSKEGQRPPGEPHVYGWAAMMTALTTLRGRHAESGGIHVQREFTGDFCRASTGASSKNHFRRTGSRGSVPWIPPDSAQLVPHHQSHEMEVRQREVRPGSSGGQRSRTSTNARRSVMQAGEKGGQQLLTSWIRPKTPSTV